MVFYSNIDWLISRRHRPPIFNYESDFMRDTVFQSFFRISYSFHLSGKNYRDQGFNQQWKKKRKRKRKREGDGGIAIKRAITMDWKRKDCVIDEDTSARKEG